MRVESEAPALRVLVVEDDFDSGEALRRLLRKAGHHVELAAGVTEVRQLPAQPAFDVLISDFNLRDGIGPDILEELSRRSPALVAVALSGSTGEAEVNFLRRVGFTHYFPKPVEWPKLRALLEEISRRQARDGT